MLKGGDNVIEYPKIIENDVAHITLPNGHLHLNLFNFFPASKAEVRKLFLKIISRCPDYRYQSQIAQEILQWVKVAYDEADIETALKSYANTYGSRITEAKEMQEDIDKQTELIEKMKCWLDEMPKGSGKKAYRKKLKAEKEKLKKLKEDQRSLKSDASWSHGQFIKLHAKAERFKANIELIEQLTAGWE